MTSTGKVLDSQSIRKGDKASECLPSVVHVVAHPSFKPFKTSLSSETEDRMINEVIHTFCEARILI